MKAEPNSGRIDRDPADSGQPWAGAVVRGTVPRGRILGIDFDPSFDWERVVRVSGSDVQGRSDLLAEEASQPVLATREVQYVGQPLLLIAAPDAALLDAAVAAVDVRYQPWMPVLDLEESIEAKIRIRGTGNVIRTEAMGVERELGRGAELVESDLTFASNDEPISCRRGAFAEPKPEGGVRVVLATLDPALVQVCVAAVAGIPPERVEIEPRPSGGYERCVERECHLATHAALMALAAGRGVRFVPKHFMGVAARHSGQITIKSALSGAGSVTDTTIDVTLDGGAYSALTETVLDRILDRAISSYDLGHLVVKMRVMATNTAPRSIIGNSGAAQVTAAIERHIERVAHRVGESPVAYRRRRLGPQDDSVAVVDFAVEQADYIARKSEVSVRSTVRTAVGLAAGFCGSTAGRTPVSATLEFRRDAANPRGFRVAMRAPVSPAHVVNVVQSTVAMACRLPQDEIEFIPNSDVEIPLGALGGACGQMLATACERIARVGISGPLEHSVRAYVETEGDLEVVVPLKIGEGEFGGAVVAACDVVEVELDLVTFEVRVVSVEAFRAVPGLPHADVRLGIERAVARVLGHGAKPLDEMCPPGLSVPLYRGMPTTAPAPRIVVREVEAICARDHETALVSAIDAVEPAIISAVEEALGVPLDFLPLTPEALATAWVTRRGGDVA